MIIFRIAAILGLGMLLSGQTSNYDFSDTVDEAFEKSTLVISASENACYVFDIYLALNYEQRRRGLMFVRDLPEFSGMLFVYDNDAILSIWMKNTYIPLDVVFIHADGTIANIHENAEPMSLQSMRSADRVRYVLELNGGVSQKLSIDTNARIVLMDLD